MRTRIESTRALQHWSAPHVVVDFDDSLKDRVKRALDAAVSQFGPDQGFRLVIPSDAFDAMLIHHREELRRLPGMPPTNSSEREVFLAGLAKFLGVETVEVRKVV